MFGQAEPRAQLPANFGLFSGELPTTSTGQINETKLSTRYLDLNLRTLFDWAIQVHRLLWPTILYLMFAVNLFYVYQLFKLSNNKSVLPAKKLSAKMEKTTMRIGKRVWNLCHVISIFVCLYEIYFVYSLSIRLLATPDMGDCVMDGVQNVTQLQNQTHMETVRSCCGIYGVPPNYVNFSTNSSLLMRVEPRNQTFVESADYFLARQNESFNFKTSFVYLATVVLLLVSYYLDLKFPISSTQFN